MLNKSINTVLKSAHTVVYRIWYQKDLRCFKNDICKRIQNEEKNPFADSNKKHSTVYKLHNVMLIYIHIYALVTIYRSCKVMLYA